MIIITNSWIINGLNINASPFTYIYHLKKLYVKCFQGYRRNNNFGEIYESVMNKVIQKGLGVIDQYFVYLN